MKQKTYDLTTGNIQKTMLRFVLPYLLSCFLQTFYGLADMFVVGLYNGSETSTAVSIGSQATHMMTVMIVGLAMGTTVGIGHCIGSKDDVRARKITGNTVILFAGLAAVLTLILSIFTGNVVSILMTPAEAVQETTRYLQICFAGIPFIIAYNVISSIYRGIGDSKSPLVFVFIACIVNIVIDFLFIGSFGMGASGAAFGTIIGQACSVVISLAYLKKRGIGFRIEKEDFLPEISAIRSILKVGFPIAMQDGLIQIAFLVITVIANSRGLIDSVSVGIVEKIICFLFLVPSAFLSAISAVTAQNVGAGRWDRAKDCLRFGLFVTVSWGFLCFLCGQFLPEPLIGIFRREPEILLKASGYLRAYTIDCMLAAVHFCFSGYFCGIQRSEISFIHNIISVVFIRVPGAYLASKLFADTLYPMGLAAPIGSFLSILICIGFYISLKKKARGII
ncbi:MAG: MATE family efflux transporter [Eubacteriales bacterium]|nr:MATE family efflux transporter [Eubacteriales bacterium]